MNSKGKTTVKAKAAAVRQKLKARKAEIRDKVKGAAKAALALVLCAVLAGCMDTAPASRYTATTIGDVFVRNHIDGLRNRPGPWATNAVAEASAPATPLVAVTTTISFAELTMASADSAGSTETQTATPTLDVRTRVDARYNDAISGATTASQKVLNSIGDGVTGVLDLMSSKGTGTVKVTKTDGTAATVKCENGQCSFASDGDSCSTCPDGSCTTTPGGAK